MRRAAAIVVLLPLAVAGCVAGGGAPADCRPTGTTAHRDVRYAATSGVAPRFQSLDLYLPARPAGCAPAPLVAYVHGGGFVTGDKRNKIADKVTLFTGEGWAFASLNYRLVGADGVGATNGRYPAPERDVAAAISYLRRHATQYRIDAARVMLLGHSAGAFLVALVSTDATFLGDLRAVVCTAPLDTRYDIAAEIANGGPDVAMYRNAFGNDPAVWERASPLNQVEPKKGIPAFHIVTRGTAGRIAQSQAFGAALRDAGVAARVQVARGLTHEQVNVAVGKAGDKVITPPLMRFFRRCART